MKIFPARWFSSEEEIAAHPFRWDRAAILLFTVGIVLASLLWLHWSSAHPPGGPMPSRASFVDQGIHHGSIDIVEDGAQYLYTAENLLKHGAYSTMLTAPFSPSTFRTPGFPIFLAFLLRLGLSLNQILLVQTLLGALLPVLLYFLGRQLLFARSSFLAALVYATLPIHLFVGQVFRTEVLLQLCFLSALTLFFAAVRSMTWRRVAGAAVLFGLTALVKPFFFFLFPLFPLGLYAASQWNKLNRRQSLLRAFALVAITGLILAPWLVRNAIVTGKPIMTSVDKYTQFAYWLVPYRMFHENLTRGEAEALALKDFQQKNPSIGDVKVGDLEEEPLASAASRYAIGEILHTIGLPTYVKAHLKHALWFITVSPYRQPLIDWHLLPKEAFQADRGLTQTLAEEGWLAALKRAVANPAFLFMNVIDVAYQAFLFLGMLFALVFWKRLSWPARGFVVFAWLLFCYLGLANGFVYGGPRHRYPVEPFLILASVCGWSVFGRRRSGASLPETASKR